ncbi:MAG: tetratricopeptide repeat protein [Luteimonas sp.]
MTSFFRHLPSVLIAAGLLLCTASEALAQGARERARERGAQAGQKTSEKPDAAQEVMYPDAARQSPDTKPTAKGTPKLQKLSDLYQQDRAAEGLAIADEIIANPSANLYEHAFAAQLAAQMAYNQNDNAAAKAYAQKAIAFNGLDNNGHYQTMYLLAQLQMQDEQYVPALATLDSFLAETKTQKPEYLVLKGNALYRLERYQEAVPVLQQAIAAAPAPKSEWTQLLMASYFESDQPAEAAKLAEQLLAKNPNDKTLQLNLASIYMQAEQNDKAVALLETLRTAGQLTQDKEYRNLYALYLSMDGQEKNAIAAINDGLEKGILKPDYQAYVALAQAYYFSDQIAPSIEAYRQAAPLGPDGETYLNLAKVLLGDGNAAEAKKAAQQALDKGVKKPEDAQKILAQQG